MDFLVGGLVSFETLCAYHPGFALGVWKGILVRPSVRIMQAQFSSTTLNQPVPAAFDSIIASYSVFAGVDISVDPTNAFAGNPQKAQSDFFQAWGASGLRFQLQINSVDNSQYNPIPVDVPMQMVPSIMRKAAGIWRMRNPDTAKGTFNMAALPPGGADAVPLTAWMAFSFLTLGPGGENYTSMSFENARAQLTTALQAAGWLPSPGGSASAAASP
jgi:hypothetical protein